MTVSNKEARWPIILPIDRAILLDRIDIIMFEVRLCWRVLGRVSCRVVVLVAEQAKFGFVLIS
jgi:hypothetical protein